MTATFEPIEIEPLSSLEGAVHQPPRAAPFTGALPRIGGEMTKFGEARLKTPEPDLAPLVGMLDGLFLLRLLATNVFPKAGLLEGGVLRLGKDSDRGLTTQLGQCVAVYPTQGFVVIEPATPLFDREGRLYVHRFQEYAEELMLLRHRPAEFPDSRGPTLASFAGRLFAAHLSIAVLADLPPEMVTDETPGNRRAFPLTGAALTLALLRPANQSFWHYVAQLQISPELQRQAEVTVSRQLPIDSEDRREDLPEEAGEETRARWRVQRPKLTATEAFMMNLEVRARADQWSNDPTALDRRCVEAVEGLTGIPFQKGQGLASLLQHEV